jgi:hypothetical protein
MTLLVREHDGMPCGVAMPVCVDVTLAGVARAMACLLQLQPETVHTPQEHRIP